MLQSNGLTIYNDSLIVGKKTVGTANNEEGVIVYDPNYKDFMCKRGYNWVKLGGIGIGVTSSYPNQTNGTIIFDENDKDLYGKKDGVWISLTKAGPNATAFELFEGDTRITALDPSSAGGMLIHKVDNVDKMRFIGDNIGIGTNNPSSNLHLVGNLKVDGSIFSSGNLNIINTNNLDLDLLILNEVV